MDGLLTVHLFAATYSSLSHHCSCQTHHVKMRSLIWIIIIMTNVPVYVLSVGAVIICWFIQNIQINNFP